MVTGQLSKLQDEISKLKVDKYVICCDIYMGYDSCYIFQSIYLIMMIRSVITIQHVNRYYYIKNEY